MACRTRTAASHLGARKRFGAARRGMGRRQHLAPLRQRLLAAVLLVIAVVGALTFPAQVSDLTLVDPVPLRVGHSLARTLGQVRVGIADLDEPVVSSA